MLYSIPFRLLVHLHFSLHMNHRTVLLRHKQLQALADALRTHSTPPVIINDTIKFFALVQDQLYFVDDARLFEVIPFCDEEVIPAAILVDVE